MKKSLFLKTLALIIGLMFQTTISWGQLLVEDFDYPIGSLLTANGWTAHSGGGTQPIDVTTGLSFSGYLGSGIGGAANLDNNGEDVNKTFAPQTTGTVYAAFVIQTQSTNAAGYFLHFGQTTMGSTFFTRVWVNATGSGIGIGPVAPTTYIPITAGVPAFLVIKYDIASKVSSLFVFSTFPTAEPATPNATFTETGTYANVGSIGLRQYVAAERVIVDGIRIATNWAEAATASGGTPLVETPTFSPTPGVTENPVDVTISCATPNSSIYYTLDGNDPDENSTPYTIPFNVSQTTTVKARAYAEGYDPSSIAAAVYTFRTQVSTIAELRAGTTGIPYLLTGEVFLTYQQAAFNEKFIQDYTAAILIYDAGGIITSEYEIGDGFTDLKGTLSLYQGMLEFIPSFNTGESTGFHLFTPEVITLADLNANFDNYESELVRIENVTFADGGGTFNPSISSVYQISDVSDATFPFRTSFMDANYLGTTIPIAPCALIGIPNAVANVNYFTSRTSADIIQSVITPTIVVTSPDGGEFWQRETTETITWGNLNFTGNVTIQLLSGMFTTPLATNIANTGTYDWAIPAGQALGSNYKIRVKGVNNGDPTDDSNGSFSIVEYVGLPRIVINEIMYNSIESGDNEWIELYNLESIPIDLEGFVIKDSDDAHSRIIPAGYSIGAGQYFTISISIGTPPLFFTPDFPGVAGWGLNNDVDQVRLYAPGGILVDSVRYSDSSPWPTGADGTGPSLELIDPALDNTLPGSWLASAATNGTPGAQNSMFGFQSLTVTSPNGAENWEQGSVHPITWTNVNFAGTIKIELETIAKGLVTLAENVSAADGTWSWAIPADQAVGSNYKIKISDQADGNPMDQSNAVFSIIAVIPPSLTVTSPNGGELWEQGTTHPITWTSVNFAGTIKIELETVAKGLVTLAENVAVTDLTWSWVIPAGQTPGTNFKIKISDQTDGDPMDESDATFSVIEVIPPTLTVTSPNGNEQWEQGSTHAITWTRINFTGDVKIELSDGAKLVTLLNDSIPSATGTWAWTIPANQALGANYTIIISGRLSGEPTDASNAPFSVIAPLPLPNLVINEIMYNPSDALGLDDYYEYLELYNNGTYTVDLSGYKFGAGITYTFPAGINLGVNEYLVVALKPDTIISHYGITNVVGPFSGGLSNSGETVRLDNASGVAVDNVPFDDAGLWPTTPDGAGPSLSLLDPNLDNSVAASWAASSQNGGTPGTINFPPVPTLTVIYPNGGESLHQNDVVNIAWYSAVFAGNIKIELVATGTTEVLFASLPHDQGNVDWTITQAIGSDYKIKISDVLNANLMDESDAVFSIAAPLSLPKIVITEIMYNSPEIGTDSLEFIELYNNDVLSVDLAGWSFTQGIEYVFPTHILMPGDYLVLAFNDTAVQNTFGVSAIQWTGGALKNDGEDIELINAASEVIDYVLFDDAAPWPLAPDDYGPSLMLCDPSSDNALAENWSSSIEFVKLNAAGAAIYATPGAGCSGDLAQTMIIPTGWAGVSSYMTPTNPAIETLFAPIVNSVVVLQDFSDLYLPFYGINTIGNWDTKVGYQSKLTAAKYFVIKGAYETNKTVNLVEGWNSLPVISKCTVNAAALFGSKPEVIFVKEMGSNLVYWPSGGLTDLISLVPGRAYYIKVSASVSLTFPECTAKGIEDIEKPANKISSIWNEVLTTGASHAIGFDAFSLSNLAEGDVIGAFTANGLCAGITEVGQGNALIMAWADDIYTLESDGFVAEEAFTYKVYRPSTNSVFEVTAVYSNNAPDAGNFVSNGISMVQELKMTSAGIGTQANANVRIYPNPANTVVNIDLMQQFTNVEVYSIVGSLLYSGNISGNLFKLDVSNFERGVYFLKLINQVSGDQTTTRFIKE